ncbi:PEPxxWA-CTERM sorting domain-containing protein [Phenylobacterium sp.]|uniref:PEPxxWA-CTERM sorting domain-containing protein n=1 Tax=Phenylobacterium sp. TaxID=1871053 RepID=UPI0025CE50BB|nr:PEPxxWA-CTERM sorting domain-containing protein [Phenylobacterium sp.]MBX3483833.1 PEPxxWA-CTERM sorting domain-containing protein [Phenylobacterium sp.]
MRLKSVIVAATAAAALSAPAQAAHFQNGSFENGFAGWTVNEDQTFIVGQAYHRDENGDPDNCPGAPGAESPCPYMPTGGDFMGLLQANASNEAVLLSQTFTTGAGGATFRGDAAFLGEDYLPWNDSAFVRIYRVGGGEIATFADEPVVLFFSSIAMTGDWGATDWTHFSLRLGPGTYRVEAGVTDVNDDREPSMLLVDNFSLTPEPATWALLIGGFFGAGAVLRRRRARPAWD